MAVGEELWRNPDVLAALERASLEALIPRQPLAAPRESPPALRQPPPAAPTPPRKVAPATLEALEAALQRATVALVLLDSEHVVSWANAAACEIVDRDPSGVIGAVPGFLEVLDVDVLEQTADSSGRAVEVWTPSPDAQEWRDCLCRRADGTVRAVLVHSTAIPATTEAPASHLLQLADPARSRAAGSNLPLIDLLTGLPNEVLLVDRLQHALARSERSGCAVAVVRLRFSLDSASEDQPVRMNQVLLAASRRLRSALRDTDTVSRSGGDGFIVVCEDIADSEVKLVSGRVVEAVGARFNIDGWLTPVTIRSGVAVGRGPAATSSKLMAEAEAAVA